MALTHDGFFRSINCDDQRVKNITTAMGNCISSMMKKEMRYGD